MTPRRAARTFPAVRHFHPAATAAMPRLLLIEDNPDIAEGLRVNLELEGYSVQVAGNASHALAVAAGEAPDLVVLDLGLPDRDGFDVLQELRHRAIGAPVLILSARGMEADKVRGFRLGADDYVTKPFGLLELMARIQSLLRRVAPVGADGGEGSEAEGAPDLAATAVAAAILPPDEMIRARFGLTDRQLAVARLLAEGYSNSEIASRLSISPFTARNHVEQVLAKVGAPSRARAGAILRGTTV
jgi:DNA-binding response OmpR family regulator